VKIGAALPVSAADGGPPAARDFASGATLLETLGYSSVWVFDAIGRGFMMPDALMALAVAATVTEHVELGTGIVQLPLRNTVELAHRALTLHHIAAGRFLFGIGPGSTADDFLALDADYKGRFDRFDDEWPRLRRLLSTGADGDADLTPWPGCKGGPSLLVAAWRGPLVTRAAVEADGWIASAAYNDDASLAESLSRFRDAGGRRAVVTNIAVPAEIGPAVSRLHALAAMGFDDAVVFDRHPSEERFHAILQEAP
jgi:alkanesulfonate monooxygenase SsuD/methylene tetrahydromethanopterin reductase-like flavin-dependent oxidoreductase (luciferase family)